MSVNLHRKCATPSPQPSHSFDSVVAVATTCGSTSPLTCADTSTGCAQGGSYTGLVTLTAATTYYIAVGSPTGGSGPLTLNVDLYTSQCTNAVPPLSVGANAFTITATGTTLSYGANVCGASVTTMYNANYRSFTPSTTTYYRFGSSATTLGVILVVQTGCDTSTALRSTDTAACSTGTSSPTRYLYLEAGRTYLIAIGAATAGDTGSGTLTVEQWNFNCAASATAISLGNTAITQTATGLDISYPAGTCASAQSTVSYDAKYYSFTPSVTGLYRFFSCDQTNFATFVVWQTACAPSSAMTCGIGNCGSSSLQSISGYLTMTGGVTVYLTVGSPTPGVTGSGTLSIQQLTGTCANPVPAVEGGNNPFALSPEGTDAFFYPITCNGSLSQTNQFFFSFTPPVTTAWRFSLCNRANFQTVLTIQTGCDTSSILACSFKNPTYCSQQYFGNSYIEYFALTAGTQYLIVVGATDLGITGTGNLLIERPTTAPTLPPTTQSPTKQPTRAPTRRPTTVPTPAPTGTQVCQYPGRFVVGANPYTTVATGTAWPNPNETVAGTCYYENTRDFSNYNYWLFTPPATNSYSFSTCGSDFDNQVSIQTGCPSSTAFYCDDDSCNDANSCAETPFIPLTGGVDYFIAISSTYPDGSGSPSTGSGVMMITASPTPAPTSQPTGAPSASPTSGPTRSPTQTPSSQPTVCPCAWQCFPPANLCLDKIPTQNKQAGPTKRPSPSPSNVPTRIPTTVRDPKGSVCRVDVSPDPTDPQ